jgi:transposase
VLWELSVVEQRYNAVMEVLRDGKTVVEVADRYGVSRQAVHRWLRRYQDGGLDGLADRSHRPRRCPHQLPEAVEAVLVELSRTHPGWGRRRLGHELARREVKPLPSRATIYRALVRNGLVEPQARRRRRTAWRRWQRERPMQLWQMDVMGGSSWSTAARSSWSPASMIIPGSVSPPGWLPTPPAGRSARCSPPPWPATAYRRSC